MTKKIKKLEKETTMYRSRWESSNTALLVMAEEVNARQGPQSRLKVTNTQRVMRHSQCPLLERSCREENRREMVASLMKL